MAEAREIVQPKMTAGLAALLSVAAGLAVGNLYWAQPLLTGIVGGASAAYLIALAVWAASRKAIALHEGIEE